MKGYCSNEVLAREGIDTMKKEVVVEKKTEGSNEVLAREGIDTNSGSPSDRPRCIHSSNEVLAREGINKIIAL